MRPDLSRVRVFRALVFLACLWEASAILTRRVPTWTKCIHFLRRSPAGAGLLGTVWGILTYHFFIEGGRDA